jgi:hypothetical protein
MIVQRLTGDRLHLHHGPMDVVLRAFGDAEDVQAAESAAAARFDGLLEELVAELPELRRDVQGSPVLRGPVARRMLRACVPFAARCLFITSMAAVAGAVADELLATMRGAAPALRKAFVNDGGDIAVFAAPGERLAIGLAGEAMSAGGAMDFVSLGARDDIGGVATSGRGGRSFSLGIADAVTVLAREAAAADAAATLIANAVNVESPAVRRMPARSLDPDSDLGDLPVTVSVGALTRAEIARALDRGAACASAFAHDGLIRGAALRLAGETRLVGVPSLLAAA